VPPSEWTIDIVKHLAAAVDPNLSSMSARRIIDFIRGKGRSFEGMKSVQHLQVLAAHLRGLADHPVQRDEPLHGLRSGWGRARPTARDLPHLGPVSIGHRHLQKRRGVERTQRPVSLKTRSPEIRNQHPVRRSLLAG